MMRKVKQYILAAILTLTGSATVFAQGSSTAVMEIRVEVVSGATVNLNSDQFNLHHCESSQKIKTTNPIEITFSVPTGSEVLTEFDDEIEMVNGTDSFRMLTSMNRRENGSSVTYSFDATSDKEHVASGVYNGTSKATIYYF